MATGTAGTVLLAAADTSSERPKCPSARVLHGLGALAKPGARRQTQAGVAGWPEFDYDFAEESGLIEPYLSAIRSTIRGAMGRLSRDSRGRSGPKGEQLVSRKLLSCAMRRSLAVRWRAHDSAAYLMQ